MNCRFITIVVLGLGLGLGVQGYAQTSINTSIKSAASISKEDRVTIGNFIKAQMTRLAGKDAAAQTEARELLCNEVNGASVGGAFTDAYVQQMQEALMPLADSQVFRTRLSAAIITTRLAERTGSIRLKPAVIKFTNDKSEPIVLWGVKATRALLPVQLKISDSGNDPLLKGLVPAITDNLSGPITQEAYEALRLNIVTDRNSVTDAMIKAVLPEIQKLLELRLAQYMKDMPNDPQVDTLATNFLVDSKVWAVQTPEQRGMTVQMLVDILGKASRRSADYDAKDIKTESKEVRAEARARKDDLVQIIKFMGSTLGVVGETIKAPGVVSAADPFSLRKGLIVSTMDSAVIIKFCDDLISAVQATPEFKSVKSPVAPATTKSSTVPAK